MLKKSFGSLFGCHYRTIHTRRAQLLNEGIIQEAIIQPVDLLRFKKSKLINAMMTWDESPEPSVIKDQLGKVIWKEKTFH